MNITNCFPLLPSHVTCTSRFGRLSFSTLIVGLKLNFNLLFSIFEAGIWADKQLKVTLFIIEEYCLPYIVWNAITSSRQSSSSLENKSKNKLCSNISAMSSCSAVLYFWKFLKIFLVASLFLKLCRFSSF